MENFRKFLDVKLFPIGIEESFNKIIEAIPNKKGDFFCFANIHSIMECYRNPELKKLVNKSSGNFPDGMGVAWALGLRENIRGTDMMLKLCSYASKNNLRIFLYGTTADTLNKLEKKLQLLFPGINIAGKISPPFRTLTKEEDREIINKINKIDPDILFVSLGAPKQEIWMAEHKGKIKAVQLGIGAAFDFITGKIKEAPRWMQRIGLEWFYRLFQQPKKTIYRMSLVPEFVFRLIEWKIKN